MNVAIEKFTQAIQEDRNFAEAFNQRAIALLLERAFAESIADCLQRAEDAAAFWGDGGDGALPSHLGQWREAKRCYRLALAIHPGMEGIEASLSQIDQVLRNNPRCKCSRAEST